MENTLEEKAKFFAQHLNQPIEFDNRIGYCTSFYLACGNFSKQIWIVSLEDEDYKENELSCSVSVEKCKVQLTPLSQISDEDAKTVCKIRCNIRNKFIIQ